MILDPARLYHYGIVVADLESATALMASEQGLAFTDPWGAPERLRTSDGVLDVTLTIVYSGQGPVHVELVQEVPGTLWEADGIAKMHHVGYWTDDLSADGALLEEAGFEFCFENLPPEGQQPSYRYYRSGLGFYVELVDTAMKPAIEGAFDYALASHSAASSA